MHAIFRKQFLIDVLLLAFLLFTSCGKGRREMATIKTGDAELRSSICKSKYYAYNLIANDSIMEGISILDSLWETYHIDRTILVAIGTAYYKLGDKELAYQWLRRAEHHIDSLIDVEPSPGLYNDLLPVVYILKGKEAAMEVMDMMAEPEKSIARNFFVEYPDRQTFLNDMVSMFDSCQYECLTQEDGLHACLCGGKSGKLCASCLEHCQTDTVQKDEHETRQESDAGCDFFYYEADESAAVEKDHGEDEIIKLERTGDNLRGTFWVTSDEFVSAREGYLPGFTVLGMQNLVLMGDSISFLLDSHGHMFFSAPLCLDISSDKEAGRQGCHEWVQESEFFADSIQYKGCIRGDTLYLDETKNRWSRKFVKMDEKAIRQIDRSMPAELEEENRKCMVDKACDPVDNL